MHVQGRGVSARAGCEVLFFLAEKRGVERQRRRQAYEERACCHATPAAPRAPTP